MGRLEFRGGGSADLTLPTLILGSGWLRLSEVEDLRRRILSILLEKGPLSFEELLASLEWKGDLRPLRRIIADMVREGLITKEPDYVKKKMVYKIPASSAKEGR